MQSPTSPAVGLPFFHFFFFASELSNLNSRKAETLQCGPGQKKLPEKPSFSVQETRKGTANHQRDGGHPLAFASLLFFKIFKFFIN